jgi:cation transport ATPase
MNCSTGNTCFLAFQQSDDLVRMLLPAEREPSVPSFSGKSTRRPLSADGRVLGAFRISDTLRLGAAAATKRLRSPGLGLEIVSGDAEVEVRKVGAPCSA